MTLFQLKHGFCVFFMQVNHILVLIQAVCCSNRKLSLWPCVVACNLGGVDFDESFNLPMYFLRCSFCFSLFKAPKLLCSFCGRCFVMDNDLFFSFLLPKNILMWSEVFCLQSHLVKTNILQFSGYVWGGNEVGKGFSFVISLKNMSSFAYSKASSLSFLLRKRRKLRSRKSLRSVWRRASYK